MNLFRQVWLNRLLCLFYSKITINILTKKIDFEFYKFLLPKTNLTNFNYQYV